MPTTIIVIATCLSCSIPKTELVEVEQTYLRSYGPDYDNLPKWELRSSNTTNDMPVYIDAE